MVSESVQLFQEDCDRGTAVESPSGHDQVLPRLLVIDLAGVVRNRKGAESSL